MRKFSIFRLLIFSFLFVIWSCFSAPRTVNPYFAMPPDHIIKDGRKIFTQALQQQKNNKMESSIDLWKRYLENEPKSFRGYNNLGMAYYSNDQLSEALSAATHNATLAHASQTPRSAIALCFRIAERNNRICAPFVREKGRTAAGHPGHRYIGHALSHKWF